VKFGQNYRLALNKRHECSGLPLNEHLTTLNEGLATREGIRLHVAQSVGLEQRHTRNA